MKETEKSRNMSGRKVIQSRGFGYRPDKEFFLEIQKAVKAGYEVAQNYRMDDLCTRNGMSGLGQVVMYRDGNEFLEDMEETIVKDLTTGETLILTPDANFEVKPSSVSKEEQTDDSTELPETSEKTKEEKVDSKQTLEGAIKSLSKKVECVEFAKEHNLEIPEDKKTVPVIKKFLKDSLVNG